MLTGWQLENNAVYYLNNNPTDPHYGAMMSGWVTVDGIDYYLDNTGKLVVNGTTPDGYLVDANGAKIGLANAMQAMTGTDLGVQKAEPLANTQAFQLYLQAVVMQRMLTLANPQ